jgi:hypothetical protein
MKTFLETYRDAINTDFMNIYATMKTGSRVSTQEYQEFLNEARIPHVALSTLEMKELQLETSKIGGAWKIQEGVVDIRILKEIIESNLKVGGITTQFSTKVIEVVPINPKKSILISDHFGEQEFDFVVIADYGMNEVYLGNLEKTPPVFEYQITAILELHSDLESFGITFMDGDFLTFLPNGFVDKSFLAYGPIPSVLYSVTSTSSKDILGRKLEEKAINFRKVVIERVKERLPNIGEIKDPRTVIGYRSIPALSKDTDKRPSTIESISPSIFRVHSGKIDHAVDIANQISNLISSTS